jgi:hypothetical protein
MDPILSAFDKQFSKIDGLSRSLLHRLPGPMLFANVLDSPSSGLSSGECILRAAAMVEKTFGGITTRLWDDPFEWTLPEKLSTRENIIEYLDEVEQTRKCGFGYFASDEDLKKEIPAPSRLMPLADILMDTLCLASNYQGRAFAIFHLLSGAKPPKL